MSNNKMNTYIFTYNFGCDVVLGPAGMEVTDEMMDGLMDIVRKKLPGREGFSSLDIPYNGTLAVFDRHNKNHTTFEVSGKYTIVFQMSSVFNIDEETLKEGFIEIIEDKIMSIPGIWNLNIVIASNRY